MYGINEIAGVDSRESLVHNTDPRVKLILLVLVSAVTVTLDRPAALLLLFGISMAVMFAAKPSITRLRFIAVMVILVVWGTMFSQAIFYYGEPRTIIFSIVDQDTPVLGSLFGELNIYREGFEYGAVQSLRFCTMLVIGLVFCWTTSVSSMLDGMLALRVPYLLAFMTVTAVRFLPAIAEEVSMVKLSINMRGGRIFHPNPVVMVNNCLKLARPVFINCYRKSNILALSIQSRAFSPESKRTGAGTRPVTPQEKAALSVTILFVFFLAVMKGLYLLYVNGIFYSTSLRALYEICRSFL